MIFILCTLSTQTLEFRIHGIANTHPSIKQTYLPFPSVALNVYLRWLIISYLCFHKLSMYFKYNILSMYFKYNILGPRIGLPYLIHEDMIITYMGCVCIWICEFVDLYFPLYCVDKRMGLEYGIHGMTIIDPSSWIVTLSSGLNTQSDQKTKRWSKSSSILLILITFRHCPLSELYFLYFFAPLSKISICLSKYITLGVSF